MMTETLLNCLIAIGAVGALGGVVLLFIEGGKVKRLSTRLHQRTSARVARGPSVLTREAWAEFEGTLPNLKQVIVVSHVVQNPANDVLRAVQANLARGVRYSFIVSQSQAVYEREGWIQVFQAYAKVAIRDHRLNQKPEDLVQILALPDDWNNPPFVFYRLEQEESYETGRRTVRRTIAFRGNQTNVGIADAYIAVDPFVGDALATALNSGAPEEIQKELGDLHEDSFADYSTKRPRAVRVSASTN